MTPFALMTAFSSTPWLLKFFSIYKSSEFSFFDYADSYCSEMYFLDEISPHKSIDVGFHAMDTGLHSFISFDTSTMAPFSGEKLNFTMEMTMKRISTSFFDNEPTSSSPMPQILP